MTDSPAAQFPLLPELVEVWQETMAWQPSDEERSQFQHLYEQILTGNQQLNLTRITDPQEFWEKHLWDSLRGVKDSLQISSLRAIDLGTGAGFPGIPIAIVRPEWRMTLLDSTRKKIQFLNHLLDQLKVPNSKTLVDRAESVGQNRHHRETYDLVLIRAVATAPVCAEYALPLLQVGGRAVLYRGQWTDTETAALESVVEILGGQIERIDGFKTPLSGSDRHCIYLRKTAPTPKQYPRDIGIPTQKPLGTLD